MRKRRHAGGRKGEVEEEKEACGTERRRHAAGRKGEEEEAGRGGVGWGLREGEGRRGRCKMVRKKERAMKEEREEDVDVRGRVEGGNEGR